MAESHITIHLPLWAHGFKIQKHEKKPSTLNGKDFVTSPAQIFRNLALCIYIIFMQWDAKTTDRLFLRVFTEGDGSCTQLGPHQVDPARRKPESRLCCFRCLEITCFLSCPCSIDLPRMLIFSF